MEPALVPADVPAEVPDRVPADVPERVPETEPSPAPPTTMGAPQSRHLTFLPASFSSTLNSWWQAGHCIVMGIGVLLH